MFFEKKTKIKNRKSWFFFDFPFFPDFPRFFSFSIFLSIFDFFSKNIFRIYFSPRRKNIFRPDFFLWLGMYFGYPVNVFRVLTVCSGGCYATNKVLIFSKKHNFPVKSRFGEGLTSDFADFLLTICQLCADFQFFWKMTKRF